MSDAVLRCPATHLQIGGTLTHDLTAYAQMPLTDAKVKNLPVGPKPNKMSDFDGLFVLVKTSGSKSWRFKYRMEGSEKLLVIGDYPSVSLLDARRIRDGARAEIAKGVDLNEAKQDAKRLRSESKAKYLCDSGRCVHQKGGEGRQSSGDHDENRMASGHGKG